MTKTRQLEVRAVDAANERTARDMRLHPHIPDLFEVETGAGYVTLWRDGSGAAKLRVVDKHNASIGPPALAAADAEAVVEGWESWSVFRKAMAYGGCTRADLIEAVKLLQAVAELV